MIYIGNYCFIRAYACFPAAPSPPPTFSSLFFLCCLTLGNLNIFYNCILLICITFEFVFSYSFFSRGAFALMSDGKAFLITQLIKNPPVMGETSVWSLGCEDPLEKGMVTHSSILALEIPWTEEPGGLRSVGSQRVKHDLAAEHAHMH